MSGILPHVKRFWWFGGVLRDQLVVKLNLRRYLASLLAVRVVLGVWWEVMFDCW